MRAGVAGSSISLPLTRIDTPGGSGEIHGLSLACKTKSVEHTHFAAFACIGHKIYGVLFVKSVHHIRHIGCKAACLARRLGRNIDSGNLPTAEHITLPRAVEHHIYAESLVGDRCKEKVEPGLVAFGSAFKRFQSLLGPVESAKSEILETHDVSA